VQSDGRTDRAAWTRAVGRQGGGGGGGGEEEAEGEGQGAVAVSWEQRKTRRALAALAPTPHAPCCDKRERGRICLVTSTRPGDTIKRQAGALACPFPLPRAAAMEILAAAGRRELGSWLARLSRRLSLPTRIANTQHPRRNTTHRHV
jgi:hypothetical protein